jgi:hypothetical protein
MYVDYAEVNTGLKGCNPNCSTDVFFQDFEQLIAREDNLLPLQMYFLTQTAAFVKSAELDNE